MKTLKNRIHLLIIKSKFYFRFFFRWQGNTIEDGPFKGMKYIDSSVGSVYFPKLVGSYEKELHPIIEEVIANDYENIVDIGCAEGYYAIGLAFRTKDKIPNIYAFDIDNLAIANLRNLMRLNQLASRIKIGRRCDFMTLNGFPSQSTFVMCDIEGDEAVLLDPEKVPNIINYDILVEIHDGGDQSDRIKALMYQRFSKTHECTLIKYLGRTDDDVKKICHNSKNKVTCDMLDEGRIFGLEWMFLKKK